MSVDPQTSVATAKPSLFDRIEDAVTAFFASRTYITGLAVFTVTWMVMNTCWFINHDHWDPYPFILLNLVFSTIAAFQQPMIMLVQKRVERRMHAKELADERETHAYRERSLRMLRGMAATGDVLTDVSQKLDLMLDSLKYVLKQEAFDHDPDNPRR